MAPPIPEFLRGPRSDPERQADRHASAATIEDETCPEVAADAQGRTGCAVQELVAAEPRIILCRRIDRPCGDHQQEHDPDTPTQQRSHVFPVEGLRSRTNGGPLVVLSRHDTALR